MNEMHPLIKQWLGSLRRRHQSLTTIRAHKHAIYAFQSWLNARPTAIQLDDLTMEVFEQYVTFLLGKRDPDLKEPTIRAYIGVIVRWLHWMESYGKFAGIPDPDGGLHLKPDAVRELLFALLNKPEPAQAPRIPDVSRMLVYYELALREHLQQHRTPTTETPAPHRRAYLNLFRNRALVATLFSTGGRVSEVMSLTAKKVQQDGEIATSVKIIGKGKRLRPLRLDDIARGWIAEYLDARAPWYSDTKALFISHGPRANGEPLTVRSAQMVVKSAALWLADLRQQEGAKPSEIDLVRSVSPHSLRHFVAQTMLDNKAQFQDIAAVLGHASSIVTQQVYAGLSDAQTIEKAEQYAKPPDLDLLIAASGEAEI